MRGGSRITGSVGLLGRGCWVVGCLPCPSTPYLETERRKFGATGQYEDISRTGSHLTMKTMRDCNTHPNRGYGAAVLASSKGSPNELQRSMPIQGLEQPLSHTRMRWSAQLVSGRLGRSIPRQKAGAHELQQRRLSRAIWAYQRHSAVQVHAQVHL